MGFLSDIVGGVKDVLGSVKDIAGPLVSGFTDLPFVGGIGNFLSGITAKDLFSAGSAALPFFLTSEGQKQVNELNFAEAERNRQFQSSMFERQHASNAMFQRDAHAVQDLWQQQARSFNQDMSREQMSFIERMNSTQWQRAVDDMKAAGLSPMLAYSKGGNAGGSAVGGYTSAGAASSGPGVGLPGGSMARAESGVPAGFNSAYQMSMMREQLLQTRAQTAKMVEEAKTVKMQGDLFDAQRVHTVMDTKRVHELTEKLFEEVHLTRAQADKAREDIRLAISHGNLYRVEHILRELEIPQAFLKARALMDASGKPTWFGEAYPYLQPLESMIGTAASAAASARFAAKGAATINNYGRR